MKKVSFILVTKKIFENLSFRRKILITIFFLFSLFSAFAETASISSVIPFMDLMIDNTKLSFYLDKLNIEIYLDVFSKNQILISITIVFIAIIFSATLLKILLGYIGTKISTSVTHEMNTLVFSQVIDIDYLTENKNDENNINASIFQVNSVTVFLEQFLSIISNLIILSFVLILVISLTDRNVIYASLIFFFLYFVITIFTKKILFKNSELLAENYNKRVSHLNNTIALFKNIKVDFLEKYFFSIFKKIDYQIAKSSLINTITTTIPGTLMISFAIIIFSILILITSLYEFNLIEKIPIYAALVFGAQKMLPMMQNIYGAISKMRANSYQALIALNLISRHRKKNNTLSQKKLNFHNKINFKNISFAYLNNQKLILKNLNFEMKQGDRILISGPSGSGKTTILNILLGLLKPQRGKILLDNKEINPKYHKNLRGLYSYIPQNIFAFNGSYKDNIALSFDLNKKINLQRIIETSKIAEIEKHIVSLKNKYDTIISHKGRNISGGQMQRLGIARGLYKDSKIIIFDESTNAIDKKNELKIYRNLNKKYKDKIFIFVSHKKINSKFFNKEYLLKNKKLVRKK
jgi:ATP-binding cassette, subfamily B, bacterial PglK